MLDIANHEPVPVTLQVVGGSLITPMDVPGAPDPPVIVRNLTAQRLGVQVPAGERESVTYSFATEMHPQDLRLHLAAILQGDDGAVYTKVVYNETVSIVEAPMSIFDPQMYATSAFVLPFDIGKILLTLGTAQQHLPLPRPGCRLWWHMLLHLHDMDYHTFPPKATRWQGR